MSGQVGIIREVGDFGLGFDPLSEEEQQIVREQFPDKDKDKEKDGGR